MIGVILVVIAVVAFVLYRKYKANKNATEANDGTASDGAKAQAAQKQAEENRFNPNGKPLEWFGSEDGIKTYHEYVTAQNYILEETLQKEHEETL